MAHKHKDYEEVGFLSQTYDLPTETSQGDLLVLIDRLSGDPTINGILVQLPLPAHLDAPLLLERTHLDRDADGFHPYSIDRLAQHMPLLRPCILEDIATLLASTGADLYSTDAVVIGASNIVDRPMALELLLGGYTATVTHHFTRDLAGHMLRADLVVIVAGKPRLAKGEQIREGTIVIDIGINRQADGRLVGDVEYKVAAQCASWVAPVPGGVGPMTRAYLLENTLHIAEHLYD